MKLCLRQPIFYIILIISGGFFLFLSDIDTIQADEFVPTTVEVSLICGDGFADHAAGEVCDPGEPPDIPPDTGTTTCADFNDIFGNPFASGDLTCESDCSDYSSSTCYTCGNGYKEEVEECDGSDFGGVTCISLGYQSGTLLCTLDCRISTINCEAMEEEGGTPGAGGHGGGSGGVSGYKPGAEEEEETKVVMRGKSYPHADVHILVDGRVIGIVRTDAKANFYFETGDITPGVASFGFWSEDKDGLKSTLLTLTFRVISGAVTTISGIYISPTIDIDNKSVKQGENITLYGQTVPDTEVHIHISSPGEIIEQIDSKETGDWQLVFNTTPLEEDFHIAKALFQVDVEGNIIKSAFSKAVSFYVGRLGGEPVCPEGDLNGDGRVNLTDFSILLYYWGTDNACADQDQNGIVDLVDFSIMMYYWTG
jgi:hypothetical protein